MRVKVKFIDLPEIYNSLISRDYNTDKLESENYLSIDHFINLGELRIYEETSYIYITIRNYSRYNNEEIYKYTTTYEIISNKVYTFIADQLRNGAKTILIPKFWR